MTDKVKCPKCGSTQITAQKRGFSIGKALLFAPLGFAGSKKIIISCLKCGHQWQAGK